MLFRSKDRFEKERPNHADTDPRESRETDAQSQPADVKQSREPKIA